MIDYETCRHCASLLYDLFQVQAEALKFLIRSHKRISFENRMMFRACEFSNTMSVKCTSNDSWDPFDMNLFRYRLILSIRGLVRILVRKFWVGELILENIHLHRTIYIKVSANILWNTVLDKAPSLLLREKKKPMVKRHWLNRSKINQTIITD